MELLLFQARVIAVASHAFFNRVLGFYHHDVSECAAALIKSHLLRGFELCSSLLLSLVGYRRFRPSLTVTHCLQFADKHLFNRTPRAVVMSA